MLTAYKNFWSFEKNVARFNVIVNNFTFAKIFQYFELKMKQIQINESKNWKSLKINSTYRSLENDQNA